MGIRKQPFGYKMERGVVVVEPREAELIRYIFQSYKAGASFLDLTVLLEKQPIRYDAQKPWNKNMVARLLADRRYLGEKGYPVILQKEDFEAAAVRRLQKAVPSQPTEAQKVLRRLCGGKYPAGTERQVLALLNGLIAHPERLTVRKSISATSNTVTDLQRRLDEVLGRHPLEDEQARQLTLAFAVAQYDALGSEEYETERLKRRLSALEPLKELDADILRAAIRKVAITGDGSVSLLLKNNQAIK